MSTEPIRTTDNTDSLTSKRAFAATRQRARRVRLKREGLLSLRLNVKAAEAAALKALLCTICGRRSSHRSRRRHPSC